MQTLKKLLIYSVVGALLGGVAASLVAPGLIAWYNEPGSGVPKEFNLAPFAQRIMASLIEAQAIGMGLGAVLMLLLGILLHRAGADRRKAREAKEALEAAARAQSIPSGQPPAPTAATEGGTASAPARLPPM